MRRVALIYNPASGQHAAGHAAAIAEALAVLRRAGIEAEALETDAPASAGTLALQAASRGCDTILACGGDGTVHEILQCLVGTPVALGVVPLGTANTLAANLGLCNGFGASPVKAVEMLLGATPMRVPVGRISYCDPEGVQRSRYFTVAAGVGVDALCIAGLDAQWKRRLGYALYGMQMLRIWATHSFPLFEASFAAHDGSPARVDAMSQLLAVRLRDFGGLLHRLAPGASLRNDRLRLVAFKTRSRLDYLRFFLAVIFRRQTFSRCIELLDAASVECRALGGSAAKVYVEADGEFLGTLPVRMEMASEALTLLIPPHAQP